MSGACHTWQCLQRPQTSPSLGTWVRICHTTLARVERRASNCAEASWERDWDKNKAQLWNAEENLKPFCTETTSVFLTGARSESWGVRWTSRWRRIARRYRLQPAKMREIELESAEIELALNWLERRRWRLRMYLHAKPVSVFLVVDVHGDVAHLGHPHKPVTLHEPAAHIHTTIMWLHPSRTRISNSFSENFTLCYTKQISAVKSWSIASKINVCLHNICVCTVYIYYVYI